MTIQTWKFKVNALEQEKGLRLDQLISIHTGLSRRKARTIIKIGGAQINQKRVKIASKLIADGSEVSVTHDATLGTPSDCNIPILFEDDWLLVVDKPAGMPSQGTRASDKHDLLAVLGRQRPDQKLTLQHRLDQGTSGILIIAKHPLAYLDDQFQSQAINKTYLARVAKPVVACTIDLAIGRVRGAVPTCYGCSGDLLDPKVAITKITNATIDDTKELITGCWVKIEPHTGRTHQIRVHLAHLDSPVLGDIFYGGEKSNQLWLHAWKIAFKHPVTGEELLLTAPPKRFFSSNDASTTYTTAS